jgi:hypothetical protein
MTWQRLLGLDGSFAFIENVFWVISLNFGFHVIFCKFELVYCNYHCLVLGPSIIGSGLLSWLNFNEQIAYFKTATHIFVGYMVIVLVIYALHCLFKAMSYQS